MHGNVPIYDVDSPHPDPILHAKLKNNPDLLTADVDHLTEHFYGSRFSYSTQALLINVLLDTLVRPGGETDEVERKTCIKWLHDPARAVPHVVIGNTKHTGGQWVDNPVKASWDIGALGYAGMLSLPGYSFDEFYRGRYGQNPSFYLRPTRRDVTAYFAEYPSHVGISDAMFLDQTVKNISRHDRGFYLASHDLYCNHLILASGIFTNLVPPRPLLQPLLQLNNGEKSSGPILIVGSGFSAADVILSTPPEQQIIHIYKWAPNTSPSPLRACHQQAYPEYAGVYRKMKLAALASTKRASVSRPQRRTSEIEARRDWSKTYEGLPDTAIVDMEFHGHCATVTLQHGDQAPFKRDIGAFAYVVGRRGSLEYLEHDLRKEVCPDSTQWTNLNGSSLREKVSEELEVAPDVFVIGSLTGDSLIRFAYGGCAYAAGRIIASQPGRRPPHDLCGVQGQVGSGTRFAPAMKGLQGHDFALLHQDRLPLDRRKSEICVEGS